MITRRGLLSLLLASPFARLLPRAPLPLEIERLPITTVRPLRVGAPLAHFDKALQSALEKYCRQEWGRSDMDFPDIYQVARKLDKQK